MIRHANEHEIIRRAQSGDEEAFESLVILFSPTLFRVVKRMVRDPSEAEAIVQETFWRTWRSLNRYDNDQPFFPYLATIALNLVRDRWRKERWVESDGLGTDFELAAYPEPEIETLVEEKEVKEDLEDAIHQLPPPYRAVIALRYQGELDYEEIAKIMKAPVNTIRTHLHRAKILLRRIIEKKNG
jgi:RNA polymerase sigma-70 factor, ECF subfamily